MERQIKRFLGTMKTERGDIHPHLFPNMMEYFSDPRDFPVKIRPHSHILGTLTGKNEGNLAHGNPSERLLFGNLLNRNNFPPLVGPAGFADPMGELGFPALGAFGRRG